MRTITPIIPITTTAPNVASSIFSPIVGKIYAAINDTANSIPVKTNKVAVA